MNQFTAEELRLILAVMFTCLLYIAVGYYLAKYLLFSGKELEKVLDKNTLLKIELKNLKEEHESLVALYNEDYETRKE